MRNLKRQLLAGSLYFVDGRLHPASSDNDFILCVYHHRRKLYLIKCFFDCFLRAHQGIAAITEACPDVHVDLPDPLLPSCHDIKQYEIKEPGIYRIYFHFTDVDELYVAHLSLEDAFIK